MPRPNSAQGTSWRIVSAWLKSASAFSGWFHFSATRPIPLGSLTEDTTYFLQLSSTVINSKQYFIKGGSSALTFQDSTGAPAPINVTAQLVPEPASALTLIAGLMALGAIRRRTPGLRVAAAT